jgi:hypothetical protein
LLTRIGLSPLSRDLDEELWRSAQQERFALLVSARVNHILSGKAAPIKTSGELTTEQETLIFADVIARAVCANLNRED